MGKEHYSDKGGHKERSDHWKSVDKIAKLIERNFTYSPYMQLSMVREQAHIIRRQMRRDPQDGR